MEQLGRKRCLFCGKEAASGVKKYLELLRTQADGIIKAQVNAIVSWRKVCASALYNSLGIKNDTTDKAYEFIIHKGVYCESCLEDVRSVEFYYRSIKLAEHDILSSLEKIFVNLKSVRNASEIGGATITPDDIEGPEPITPSTLTYKQVVNLLYLKILKSCSTTVASRIRLQQHATDEFISSFKYHSVSKPCLLCGNQSVGLVDKISKKSEAYLHWQRKCADCVCYFFGMEFPERPYHFFFEKARYCYQCHLEIRDLLLKLNMLKSAEKLLKQIISELRDRLHRLYKRVLRGPRIDVPVATNALTQDVVKCLPFRTVVVYLTEKLNLRKSKKVDELPVMSILTALNSTDLVSSKSNTNENAEIEKFPDTEDFTDNDDDDDFNIPPSPIHSIEDTSISNPEPPLATLKLVESESVDNEKVTDKVDDLYNPKSDLDYWFYTDDNFDVWNPTNEPYEEYFLVEKPANGNWQSDVSDGSVDLESKIRSSIPRRKRKSKSKKTTIEDDLELEKTVPTKRRRAKKPKTKAAVKEMPDVSENGKNSISVANDIDAAFDSPAGADSDYAPSPPAISISDNAQDKSTMDVDHNINVPVSKVKVKKRKKDPNNQKSARKSKSVSVDPDGRTRYRCNYDRSKCWKQFYDLERLHDHLKRHAENHGKPTSERLVQCKQGCNTWLCSEEARQNHIRKKHLNDPLPYHCTKCDKKYVTDRGLARHYETDHSDVAKYMCEYCGKAFFTHDNYQCHLRKVHTEKLCEKFKCTICDRGFINRKRLDIHKKLHEDASTPFKCVFCVNNPPDFGNAEALREHVLERHMKDDPKFPCEHCGRMFRTTNNLKNHVIRIHEKRGTIDKSMRPCYFCSMEFNNPYDREEHMLTHRDNKTFLCLQCGQTFSSKRLQVRHIQRKHENNEYPCSSCERKFRTEMDCYLHRRQYHGINKNGTPAKSYKPVTKKSGNPPGRPRKAGTSSATNFSSNEETSNASSREVMCDDSSNYQTQVQESLDNTELSSMSVPASTSFHSMPVFPTEPVVRNSTLGVPGAHLPAPQLAHQSYSQYYTGSNIGVSTPHQNQLHTMTGTLIGELNDVFQHHLSSIGNVNNVQQYGEQQNLRSFRH